MERVVSLGPCCGIVEALLNCEKKKEGQSSVQEANSVRQWILSKRRERGCTLTAKAFEFETKNRQTCIWNVPAHSILLTFDMRSVSGRSCCSRC